MSKRIIAWLMLILFIFLIVNILLLHIYWELSLGVYLIVLVYTLFNYKKWNMSNNLTKSEDNNMNNHGSDERDSIEGHKEEK